MGVIAVLFLLVSGIIFLLQNRDPITLFILGNSSQTALFSLTLPLGLWVILFIGLGILTSLLLQVLQSLGTPKVSVSPRPPARPRPPQPAPRRSPPPPSREKWEWENPIPEADNWEDPEPLVDRPPDRPKAPPEDRPVVNLPRRDAPTPEPPLSPPVDIPPASVKAEDLKQFEVNQSPQQSNREGTLYSYTYREPRRTKTQTDSTSEIPSSPAPAKPVYDADYRVINPASRSPDATTWEEDEDWV